MEECQEIEFKEHLSLNILLEKIPDHFQQGLNVMPLNFTCIDAFRDHLIIGTNIGLVYLIHLPSYELLKLRTKNYFPIQCVSGVSSVDDMIAAGCQKGGITIFQKPSLANNQWDLYASQGGLASGGSDQHSPKMFSLFVHKTCVTSLTWSKNGMKLFSGDISGTVCVFEIDFDSSQCSGKCLFKVDKKIIQMSYCHQKLAVADEESCVIYDFKSHTQRYVGKKSHHIPGAYGCAFSPSTDTPMKDVLYCVRPSNKIWSSNSEGEVLFSYIQKKVPSTANIQLLSPVTTSVENIITCFNYVAHYRDSILICHSKNCLFILDILKQKVIGYSKNIDNIKGISVEGDNLLILNGNRSLFCLSPAIPLYGVQISAPMSQSLYFPLQESLNLASLSKLTSNALKSKIPENIKDGIVRLGESVVTKLTEMAEPNIIQGTSRKFPSSRSSVQSTSVYNPQNSSAASDLTVHVNGTPTKAAYTEDVLEAREVEDTMEQEALETSRPKFDLDSILVPEQNEAFINEEFNSLGEAKNEEELKRIIEENEHKLAALLDLDCLTLDHGTNRFTLPEERNNPSVSSSPKYVDSTEQEGHLSCHLLETAKTEEVKDNCTDSKQELPMEAIQVKDVSFVYSSKDVYVNETLSVFVENEVEAVPDPEQLNWGWEKHNLPVKCYSITGASKCLFITEQRNFYFSENFHEVKENVTTWKSGHFSRDVDLFDICAKDVIFQTNDGIVYKFDSDELRTRKRFEAEKLIESPDLVHSILDRAILWTLNRKGEVVAHTVSSAFESPAVTISCDELQFIDLVAKKGVVWGLTNNGRIAYRVGICSDVPVGVNWGLIPHKSPVVSIHLTDCGFGFMLDISGSLYAAFHVQQTCPQGLDGKWWQIGVGNDMMEICKISSEVGKKSALITSNDNFLFVSVPGHGFVYSLPLKSLQGHFWKRIGGENAFTSLCSKSLKDSYGVVYGLDSSGTLYGLSPQSDWTVVFDAPKRQKISSFSSHPDALWVTTTSGKVFIRTGISGSRIRGSKWISLNLQQIDNTHLRSLSLSSEVLWAVDMRGNVYMRQGSLSGPPSPTARGLDPAWLQVDCDELFDSAIFKKVCVGHKSHLVWGIDSSRKIYVRERIDADFAIGSRWGFVPGLLAHAIAISGDRVFVITPTSLDASSGEVSGGQLYERDGISSTNSMGTTWRLCPTGSLHLIDISVTVDNSLWALNLDGLLYRLVSRRRVDLTLGSRLSFNSEYGLADLDEWELV